MNQWHILAVNWSVINGHNNMELLKIGYYNHEEVFDIPIILNAIFKLKI